SFRNRLRLRFLYQLRRFNFLSRFLLANGLRLFYSFFAPHINALLAHFNIYGFTRAATTHLQGRGGLALQGNLLWLATRFTVAGLRVVQQLLFFFFSSSGVGGVLFQRGFLHLFP